MTRYLTPLVLSLVIGCRPVNQLEKRPAPVPAGGFAMTDALRLADRARSLQA